VVKPTVAMPVLLLLHVPPAGTSESVTEEPIHAVLFPETGVTALTVTVVVAIQPAALVKVIVAVPVAMPATIPLPEPTVAIAVLPLLHVPDTVVSFKVIVEPTQTGVLPVTAPGRLLTVITVVAKQPEVMV
jgi:hypothetical protein